ncbi:MAG: hypothetical protein E7140_02430 [Rikenellaceae bacterium]|nr:hypothetical protein [Rikenellaceae bacterium]
MKRIFKLFMAVAAVAGITACTTDTTEDLGVDLNGGPTTLTLSLDDTRTQLGEKADGIYPLTWAEGDAISVNGYVSNALAEGEANGTTATFTFKNGFGSAPYFIAYPAVEGTTNQVVFAAEQTHTSNTTFGNGAAVMYGYANDLNNVTLKHLTGVLKIGIVSGTEAPAFIEEVRISTVDRKPIAGAFNVDAEGKLTATKGATKVITYKAASNAGFPVPVGTSTSENPAYIHVAVPAGVYGELYITLESADGVMFTTIKTNTTKPINAGTVREFTSNIVFEPATTAETATNPEVYLIANYGDLIKFKEAVEGGSTLNAIFVNDVEVPDAGDVNYPAWEPINAPNYIGTITGNGYAIKGLYAPLFETTSASFKGLHLEVNIEQTGKPTTGAFARRVTSITEEGPSVFENCSTSGTITINNTSSTATAFADNSAGTFVGIAKGVDFKSCVNNANVVIKSAMPEGQASNINFALGGFVAYTDVSDADRFVSFYNCTNNGNITWNEGTQTRVIAYIGGFVGCYRGAQSVATFENSVNNGNINIKANTRGCNIGGMIGYSNGTSGSPKVFTFAGKTTNNGSISMSGANINNYNRLGGIFGYPTVNVHITFEGEVVNKGNIVISGSSPGLRLGGVIGVPDNGSTVTFNSSVTNKGSISVEGKHTDNVYMAGLLSYTTLGKCALTFNGDAVNEGAMTFGGTTPDLFIAGLLGHNKEAITIVFDKKATNSATGDISVSGTVSSELFVGGLVATLSTGHAKEGATDTVGTYSSIKFNDEALNEGAITISGTHATTYIGGIIGLVTTWSQVDMYNGAINSDKADITFSGTSNGYIMCGGIVGQHGSASKASRIYIRNQKTVVNKGDIEFGMTCTSASDRNVGGVIGYGRNSNFYVYNNSLLTNEGKLHVTKDAATKGRWNMGGIFGYWNGNNVTSGDSNKGAALNKGDIIFEGTANGNTYVGGIAGDNFNSTRSLESFINTGNITVLTKLVKIVDADNNESYPLLHVGGIQGTMYSSDRGYRDTQVHCDIIACIDNGDGTYSPCPNVGMGTGDVVTTSTSTDETTGETTTTVKTPAFSNVKLGGRIATAVTIGADGKAVGQFTDLTATNIFDYAIGIRENRTEYEGVLFLESKDAIDYGTWGN